MNTSLLQFDDPQFSQQADLALCWRLQDCGSCLRSPDGCAWCPYSSTCVALPDGGHILSPIRDAHICPLPWQERWELRTSTFGCNCSTTTLLAAIITCVSTLLALLLLWGLIILIRLIIIAVKGARSGWILEESEDGQERREYLWIRRPRSWRSWWRTSWARVLGKEPPEEEAPLLD